jgi:signal transduction histidine kinase
MPELRSLRLHRHAADAAVVAGVLAAAITDQLWELPGPSTWQWASAAALTSLVLLARRRWPLGAAAGVLALWLAVHTPDAADDPFFQFVVIMMAVYALGRHARLGPGIAGLVLAVAVFGAMNAVRGGGAAPAIAGLVQFSVVFGFGRVIGRGAARQSALEAEAERARATLGEERARIARDLHDALGHTISAVTLQVGAVRRRLGPGQDAEREMLLRVERSGRESVAEMRRLLGMLREAPDGEALAPVPTLAEIEDIAAGLRASGVPVDVHVEGDTAELPAGVDLAAYRIVQEALTNVVKHAGGSGARVRVAYEPAAVVVEVCDDGAATGPAAAPGHGLIGMRERAALYGGRLEAGPRDGGGFRVMARLPRAPAG